METAQPKPLGVLLCRLFWVLLGPVGVLLTAASIGMSDSGWLTSKALVFAALLLATILCRWGDFLKGEGTNALGDPVTQKYMLGYTVIALIAGVALWAAANVVGNHLL
jgi:hypothetical protein